MNLISKIKDLAHNISEGYLIFGKPINGQIYESYENGEIENNEILKRVCELVNQNVYLSLFHDNVTDNSDIKFEYANYDKNRLKEFILERIRKSLDANPSVITAVLESGERDINEIAKKVSALNNIVSKDSFKEQFSTFKRVANISKEIDLDGELPIDTSLFCEPIESELYSQYTTIISKKYNSYEEQLSAMFALKPKLDSYFDDVMVNLENRATRINRKNTVASIYKSFKEIADIKEISI